MITGKIVPELKTRTVSRVLLVCALALASAGCSTDWASFKADYSWWSSSKSAGSEPLARTASADALIGPGGACPTPSAEVVRGAVAVGMTECDVVNALGPTSLVDIGTNERGERAVVVTYSDGLRPGVYRFTSGILVSIEQLPESPRPQRPQRRQQRG